MNKLVITVLEQNGCREVPLAEYIETTNKNREKFLKVAVLKPGEYGYEEGKVEYQDESGCGISVDKIVFCDMQDGVDGVIAFEVVPGKLYAEQVFRFINTDTFFESIAYSKIYEGGTKYMIPCRDHIVIVELVPEFKLDDE